MASIYLTSTGLLTALLVVGLVFFVRAAVKDRTQTQIVPLQGAVGTTMNQLRLFLQQRGYRLVGGEPGLPQLVWQGRVAPSWPLALLLSLLVGVSGFCVGLVLASLVPQWGVKPLSLALLAPLAGIFYWRGAGRVEQVVVQVQDNGLQITAQRDELKRLVPFLQAGTTAAPGNAPSPPEPPPRDNPPNAHP
ncbi:MAG: cofactor assembly of complex C subunit B [Gloeomargarita sp. DG02_3_bins_56]